MSDRKLACTILIRNKTVSDGCLVSGTQSMRLEFYDVDFASQNCSDIRVDVYSNGYLKTEKDLVETFCDPAALGDFVCDSNKGFYVAMTSSSNVHSGQIKARFSAPAGEFLVLVFRMHAHWLDQRQVFLTWK